MKTYQGFIFTVSGGSFFNGQRKPALSPNNWKLFKIYSIWGSNTSFEFFFVFFFQFHRKIDEHDDD